MSGHQARYTGLSAWPGICYTDRSPSTGMAPPAKTVGSPTAISRDFICNVTSLSCDILPKSGQDGWCDRSGDGASLGQRYGAVSGGIGYQRVCVMDQ